MALLERRELDAGIWRMATEPPTGFTSLRLHESAFLVAMPEEHHLSSFSTVPLEALRDSILLQCRPFTLTGIFAASLPAGGIFTGCYSRS